MYLGDRVNNTGTTHGSIEKIGEQWYVFYHRLTHGSDYSRQACAEKITIEADGSIRQVCVTSCGLNDGDLTGMGTYNATVCCQLTNGKMPHNSNSANKGIPIVTHEGQTRFIQDMKAGTKAVYKYFDFSETKEITLVAKGKGSLSVEGQGTISVDSQTWKPYNLKLKGEAHAVLVLLVLSGKIDVLEFIFQ